MMGMPGTVSVVLECTRCGAREPSGVSAAYGIKPGTVLEQDHLEGMCLKLPGREWAKLDGTKIMDPDGWRGRSDHVTLDTPITYNDYLERRGQVHRNDHAMSNESETP